MKTIYSSLLGGLALSLTITLASCSLIEPGDTQSPNVTDDTYLNQPNAMQTWVNGVKMNFAQCMGSYAQLMEILSDNYYNNYTRSNRVFDTPVMKDNDEDVIQLQRYVGTLRESVDYAYNTVRRHDPTLTRQEQYDLYTAKTFSQILAGEFFTALPDEDGGEPVEWRTHLTEALALADSVRQYAANDSARAFAHTLKARIYYRLGQKTEAVSEAKEALRQNSKFYVQVTYDGANNINNVAQEAIWGTWFQPLPRLDFLDPKYVQLSSTYQSPVTIAKAEEDYLILAEAAACDNDGNTARSYMQQLLTLVAQRPVLHEVDDHLEGRFNGGSRHYPTGSAYAVAASADDSLRHGLVLDRTQPISVPIISGTSVTTAMIEAAQTQDELLELIYLMRQEIFFGEGRRPADLGLRMPLSNVEAAHVKDAKDYGTAVIPPFIPTDGGLDDFTMDEDNHTVVIKYNMNRVIVENKNSEYVVPFI